MADSKLLDAMAKVESGGEKDPAKAVSNKGAQGKFQVMPATFKEWSGKLGIENADPFNPEHSRTVASAYMDWLKEQFNGDTELALAAYNAGIGRIKSLMTKYKAKTWAELAPKLKGSKLQETYAYVPKVLSKMEA